MNNLFKYTISDTHVMHLDMSQIMVIAVSEQHAQIAFFSSIDQMLKIPKEEVENLLQALDQSMYPREVWYTFTTDMTYYINTEIVTIVSVTPEYVELIFAGTLHKSIKMPVEHWSALEKMLKWINYSHFKKRVFHS